MNDTSDLIYKSDSVSYDKGFIYIASNNGLYYELALQSATSLRDYYPDANITLFTHRSYIDDRCLNGLFDEVRVAIPKSVRAKMWCMARTPYNTTTYIDCDSFINHRDVKKIHEFADKDNLTFGSNVLYTVSRTSLTKIDYDGNHIPLHHGSICVYDSNSLTIDFLQTWYYEYIKQRSSEGWEYEAWSPPIWKKFDMFTLWRIINNHDDQFKRFQSLNIGIMPNRWNSTCLHIKKDIGTKPPVVIQVDKVSISETSYMQRTIDKNLELYPKKMFSNLPNEFD